MNNKPLINAFQGFLLAQQVLEWPSVVFSHAKIEKSPEPPPISGEIIESLRAERDSFWALNNCKICMKYAKSEYIESQAILENMSICPDR